jgi:hypothetical protein
MWSWGGDGNINHCWPLIPGTGTVWGLKYKQSLGALARLVIFIITFSSPLKYIRQLKRQWSYKGRVLPRAWPFLSQGFPRLPDPPFSFGHVASSFFTDFCFFHVATRKFLNSRLTKTPKEYSHLLRSLKLDSYCIASCLLLSVNICRLKNQHSRSPAGSGPAVQNWLKLCFLPPRLWKLNLKFVHNKALRKRRHVLPAGKLGAHPSLCLGWHFMFVSV